MRQDGDAIDVLYNYSTPSAKGTPVFVDGFHGVLMADASSGDSVAIEIKQRVHEITVAGGVTGTKGTKLYITTAGVITNTVGSNRFFGTVVSAKDVNNVLWVLLAPQNL